MSHTYVIFSALYAPHVGGVETYTAHLAQELVQGGDRAIVVTSDLGTAPARETDAYGVEIIRTPCRPLMGGRFPYARKDSAFEKALIDVERAQPDYVVVQARFYPLSVIGARWAQEHGIVPVVIDHGSAHLTAGNPLLDRVIERVEHAMTSRQMRAQGTYYGVSTASCSWLAHFGIEAAGVLPNAIDAAAFRAHASVRDFRVELGIDARDMLVAFTGRLEPEKGPDKLIEAARFIEEMSDETSGATVPRAMHVALAGDGSMRERLVSIAPPHVHLLGPLAPADVAALLLSSDVFCLPTRSEGFSTSLLEAAACASAPVITNVGGVAELMGAGDDPCGIVLKDASAETIARALCHLRDHAEIARAYGVEAQRRVETRFTWKETADRVRTACSKAQMTRHR